jgi:hypothetical protein
MQYANFRKGHQPPSEQRADLVWKVVESRRDATPLATSPRASYGLQLPVRTLLRILGARFGSLASRHRMVSFLSLIRVIHLTSEG